MVLIVVNVGSICMHALTQDYELCGMILVENLVHWSLYQVDHVTLQALGAFIVNDHVDSIVDVAFKYHGLCQFCVMEEFGAAYVHKPQDTFHNHILIKSSAIKCGLNIQHGLSNCQNRSCSSCH